MMSKIVKSGLLWLICCELVFLWGCSDVKKGADDAGENLVIRSQDRANTIKLRKDLQTINRSIELFHARFGRYPESLDELAQKGALARIPREAFGGEWNYNPSTGEVTSSSHPEFETSTSWD
ncbi:hypothetical protein JW979_05425 [bacterium]|nr:hypothetical protein [candidate division CSSED10-310 bacterium]